MASTTSAEIRRTTRRRILALADRSERSSASSPSGSRTGARPRSPTPARAHAPSRGRRSSRSRGAPSLSSRRPRTARVAGERSSPAWLGEERVLSFPERETMPYEIGTRVRRRGTSAPAHALARAHRDRAGRDRRLAARADAAHDRARRICANAGGRCAPAIACRGTRPRRGSSSSGTSRWPRSPSRAASRAAAGSSTSIPRPPSMPIRIELFGDDIETLRTFDPVTQRSQDAVDAVDVLPAREYSLDGATELAERLAAADWDHPRGDGDELASYVALVEALREGRAAPGTDAFAAALGATASLLDHIGDRATVVFEDSVELGLTQDAHEAQADERREELRAQGLAVAAFPPPYVPRDRIDAAADEHGAVRVRPDADAMRLGWGGIASLRRAARRVPPRGRAARPRPARRRFAAGRAPRGAARRIAMSPPRRTRRCPSRPRRRLARSRARSARRRLRGPGARICASSPTPRSSASASRVTRSAAAAASPSAPSSPT